MGRSLFVSVNLFHARRVRELPPIEPKTWTSLGRGGARWHEAGRGGAGQRRSGAPRARSVVYDIFDPQNGKQVSWTRPRKQEVLDIMQICRFQNPDTPRARRSEAGHGRAERGWAGRGEAGCGAVGCGGAGRGEAGRGDARWRRGGGGAERCAQGTTARFRPPNWLKTGWRPVDDWLTTGCQVVYPRDDGRSSFLAAGQWTVASLSLQIQFMQDMSGKQIQNSDKQRAQSRTVSRKLQHFLRTPKN